MIAISTAVYIVIAVLVFGLLIFIHELGHFLFAKWSNVKVNEFSLGMGPAFFKLKRGETQYSLRVFPIGGFVNMEGEDESSADSRAFNNIVLWKRILIVCAGAVFNIILGFLLVILIILSSSSLGSTTVSKFASGAVSSQSGLMAGDQITRINGSRVNISTDIVYDLMLQSGGKADLTVVRAGKTIRLSDVKFPVVSDGSGGNAMTLDFYVKPEGKNLFTVLKHSFCWTLATVKLVWLSLVKLLVGSYSVKEMSGPVGVSVAMGQAASQGLPSLLMITALITINLGVVNLLPLPALDGGRLMFLLLEAVRRKPVKPEVEGYIHFAGFVLLMLLVVVVTYNDLLRLKLFG